MSTVIIRTQAGKAHDHAVRMGNTTPSKPDKIICYKHEPITDPVEIQAITEIPEAQQSLVITDFAQTGLSDIASSFLAVLDHTVKAQINAVSLHLENGVIWGYAPYFLATNGLEKTKEFIAELEIITAEMGDSETLILRQELFDLREMRELLLESVTGGLDDLVQQKIQEYLCAGLKAPALNEPLPCQEQE